MSKKLEKRLDLKDDVTLVGGAGFSKTLLSKKSSKFRTNTMYKGNQSNKTKRANNLFNLYEDISILDYN